jgi:ribokinase
MTSRSAEVAVVGSLNADHVVAVARRPGPGETVIGGDARVLPGGKGANQAAAVARAGGAAAMVGAVGDDGEGALVLGALRRARVDVGSVARLDGVRTGTAYIFVTPDGENAIVVASGANRRVDARLALDAVAALDPRVVLLQGELTAQTTAAVLRGLAGRPPRVVLNLAPVSALPGDALERCDVLVVNAGEAALLLGREAVAPAGAQDAAAALRRHDGQAVVITLGRHGAVAVDAAGAARVPAPEVEVVDTTGAGDAFAGVLALAAARGAALDDAVRQAVAAGAAAVGHPGAQPPG